MNDFKLRIRTTNHVPQRVNNTWSRQKGISQLTFAIALTNRALTVADAVQVGVVEHTFPPASRARFAAVAAGARNSVLSAIHYQAKALWQTETIAALQERLGPAAADAHYEMVGKSDPLIKYIVRTVTDGSGDYLLETWVDTPLDMSAVFPGTREEVALKFVTVDKEMQLKGYSRRGNFVGDRAFNLS